MSEKLYESGFINLTNIDYSSVCIEKMSKKHEDKPNMKCITNKCLIFIFKYNFIFYHIKK